MFTNAYNFRDLSTADRDRVRPGRVYRSDALTQLDDAEWARLRGLGVRTVLDLRTPEEVVSQGRVRADAAVDYHNLSLLHTFWDTVAYDESQGVARYLCDRYLDITEEGAAQIAACLTVLASPDAGPVVFHCAGGKDRTGVLAALVLALLGASDAAIVADYARTADTVHLVTARLAAGYGHGHFPPFSACPGEAMDRFLTGLRVRHGSVDRYVASIGVPASTVAALRTHLENE
ncbi:tyrosine-protein phosphatase [Longispora sp. K20-0274]|uniref:tyrosine-protein phosphatase n=1 Tax=Longispora sp. K20-0274 TaxID=3088255 RepID=UPI00399AC0CB